MPGFPGHHQLLELTQTHAHQVGDAIQPSHPVVPFSSHLQSFPASGSFQMGQFFTLSIVETSALSGGGMRELGSASLRSTELSFIYF